MHTFDKPIIGIAPKPTRFSQSDFVNLMTKNDQGQFVSVNPGDINVKMSCI